MILSDGDIKSVLLLAGLVIVFEFITLALRLAMHMKSGMIQKNFHCPRVHHSYVGAVLVAVSIWIIFKNPDYNSWLFLIGLALIISDLLHHLLFLYLIRKYRCDIGMVNHPKLHHIAQAMLGIFVTMVGVVALLTPFTPGSWLIPIGLATVISRERAVKISKMFLGHRLYRYLKIDSKLLVVGTNYREIGHQ